MVATIPMIHDKFVVVTENMCEFYKVVEGKSYLMGYLFNKNYYEEVLMYIIDKWNRGGEVELLT
jgi:hypothetical protein